MTREKHEYVLRHFLMEDLDSFVAEISNGVRNVNVPDEQSKFTLEKMPVS